MINYPFGISDNLCFVYITTYCNMNCSHCYVQDKIKEPQHMELGTIKQILKYIRTIGFWQVEFLGGEPLLHPQIVEIISYARSLNFNIFLATNGTIQNKNLSQIDYLSVSIDHPLEGTDIVSTRNVEFNNRIIENLQWLRNSTKNLNAIITLSNKNKNYLGSIISCIEKFCFDSLLLHYYTPVGGNQDLVIPPLEYINIIKDLENSFVGSDLTIRYQPKYLLKSEIDKFVNKHGIRYLGNKARFLGEGIAFFPDGSVHFDPLFFDKEPVGYFNNDEILFCLNNNQLRSLFKINEKCLVCEYNSLCGGYDSVSHFYSQHTAHSKCSKDFIPIETTVTLTIGK